MELVITNLEKFANVITSNLDELDWGGKRNIIRLVVRRIEMGNEEINIVYKINNLPEHKKIRNIVVTVRTVLRRATTGNSRRLSDFCLMLW
jgi:hypothetical protein